MASGTAGVGFTLLVADDDPTILGMLRLLFQREGYRVITATNGADAVQCCREDIVDIAVLDVVMPVMDGLEAAKVLRSSPLTFSIPIVFCTGSAHLVPTWFGEPYQANVRLLSKPFQLAELRDSVRELVARERTLSLAFAASTRVSTTT